MCINVYIYPSTQLFKKKKKNVKKLSAFHRDVASVAAELLLLLLQVSFPPAGLFASFPPGFSSTSRCFSC